MEAIGITAIVSLIGTIIALYIALKKAPHETKEIDARIDNQDANTAEKYLAIADRAAERALKLEERVIELECEVNKLKAENHRYQNENLDLREWADRLVHQVKSLGGDPVKLRLKEDKQS